MILALLRLSLKNLLRHKLRNTVLAFILMLTSCLMIYSAAFHRGVQLAMNNLLINTLTGHLQIGSMEYPENCLAIPEMKWKSFIPGYERLIPVILTAAPQVRAISPRITFGAVIYREDALLPLKIIGIDPLAESTVCEEYHLQNNRPLSALDERGILLSHEMQEHLAVKIGDEVDLLTGNVNGDIAAQTFRIQGILEKTGVDVFIGEYAFIHLAAAQGLIETDQAACTLVLKLNDPGQVDETQLKLQDEFYRQGMQVRVNTWQDIRGIFAAMNRTMQFFGQVGNWTLFVVILIGVVNAVLMSVYDRTREIGILMAIGSTPVQICFIFLCEMILLASVAVLAGILFSSVMILRVSQTGLSAVNETVATLWGGGRLYPQISAFDLGLVYVKLLCIVLAGTLFPAVRAARKNPTATLRYI
jgi:putative ABC transport system permease protein